jgi:hypothetical protein
VRAAVNQDEAGEEEFFRQAERSRVVVVVRCAGAEGIFESAVKALHRAVRLGMVGGGLHMGDV